MPVRAARICGCGQRVPSGARCQCQLKRDQERKARFDAKRPSARARGYDTEWQKAAAAFLRQHNECDQCGAPSTVVMHIKSIRERPDLRMVPSNWRPGCHSCNAREAAAERGNRGVIGNFRDRTGTGGGPAENHFAQTGFPVNANREAVQ